MLAKIFPRFVIQKVIFNSMHAQAMTCELLKQPLGMSLYDSFYFQDCKKFYEVEFYGHIARISGTPSNFVNQQQRQAYNKAYQKFCQFNETSQLIRSLSQFTQQVHKLYNKIESNIASSNVFSQTEQTQETFENNLIDLIKKYRQMEDKLQNYPQWKDKVIEEVGNYFHNIYNNLTESETKRKIFMMLNKQEYFI